MTCKRCQDAAFWYWDDITQRRLALFVLGRNHYHRVEVT